MTNHEENWESEGGAVMPEMTEDERASARQKFIALAGEVLEELKHKEAHISRANELAKATDFYNLGPNVRARLDALTTYHVAYCTNKEDAEILTILLNKLKGK